MRAGHRFRLGGREVMRAVWLVAVALVLAALNAPGVQAKSFSGEVPDVPSATSGAGAGALPSAIARIANLPYGGGPVLHSNRTHVIFWAPAGSGLSFDRGYESLIERFLARVAADSHRPSNVYGLTGQYTDSAGPATYDSKYRGAVIATDPLPANGCHEPQLTGPGWSVCLTDDQLEDEIDQVVRTDRLATGATDIYFLLTPAGLGSCVDSGSSSCALGGSSTGYCGYHSTTANGLLYAVIPYNAVSGHCQSDNPRPNSSTADPTISSLSHEHNETITDPEGDAWIDDSGDEDGDLCISHFGRALGGSGARVWNEAIHGGHYYLQEEWSNEQRSCRQRAQPDSIWFGNPRRESAGKLVFSASARDPEGAIISYDWFFGDGLTGRGRRVTHRFSHAGVDRVVLQITDSAGNYAFYTRVVRVARGSAGLASGPSGLARH